MVQMKIVRGLDLIHQSRTLSQIFVFCTTLIGSLVNMSFVIVVVVAADNDNSAIAIAGVS